MDANLTGFTCRIGGLLVLAAGALHVYLYVDYFSKIHVVGILFLVNGAVAAVIGAALLVVPNGWATWAGIAYCAGTLGAFFLSVYHGLFGYVESLRGPWQEGVGGVEFAGLVLLLASAAQLGRTRQTGWRPWPYRPIEAGRVEEAHRR
jgi:hypothetical protein